MDQKGFPSGFLWGAATSAPQIEGGYKDGGRTESIWDTANPKHIQNGEDCHVSCDHYHHWKEDVRLMKEIGLKSYRFSISWSRIMPEEGKINPEGIKFYSDLIDELLENGIEPLATVFHWDTPVWVYKKGAWLSKKIVPLFQAYVKVVVEAFSDRVTYWLTMNEPQCFIMNAYLVGAHAPFKHRLFALSKLTRNAMLAHGAAVKTIRQYAKKTPKIGIAFASGSFVPEDLSAQGIEEARQNSIEKGSGMFANRWWMDPILNGKPVKAFGIFHSNQKDMSDICQKLDFVGLNIYAPLTDYSKKSKTAKPEPGQPLTSIGWVVDGRVMYWTAKFVYERYKLPILITENGMADNDWVSLDSKVHDPQRTDYIQRYLSYVKKALAEGIPIIGYQYWSLFDNFEWALGYQPRFGLIHIDYKTQERTVKDSAFEYKKIIETNGSDLPIAKLKVAGIMENQTTQKIDGIMSSHFFDSRVTTRRISKKEIWFGHLIGPLGLIFVVNTLAAIVEKFLTQQAGAMYPNNADKLAALGIQYETIMTAAKIIGIFLSLFNGWLIQHIKSKQGRFRPLYFISGFVTIAIGATIFLFAGQNSLGDNYWFYFFAMVVLFNTVGSCYFYLFRDNIVSLSSRSAKDKEFLTFIRKVSWTLISGIVIGLVFNSVLIPYWLDHDISGYPKLMLILSLAAIPLFLLEYYYTKERVTEDVTYEEGLEKVNKVPLKAQLKALVTDKYFMILFVLTAVGTAVDTFKGGNVQYFYIKFLLGGETNYSMYTLYQVITGVPLGLGAIFIYPLSKKFGVKNISMVGYGLVFIGSILGWIMPDNLPIVMVGGFLRQTGMIPNSYIFPVLAIYANDDIEYRSKIRVEGLLGASLFTAIVAAISAPFAGGYESMLFKMGFVDADGVSATAEQKQFMTLSFYLFDLINSGLSLILLSFVDIEKKMPTISAELLRRKKEATLAKGEVWVEPEEAERLEAEQNAIEAENDRIADLKDRCAKKGLDFETENKKYLDRQEAKAQRKHKHNKA